MIKTESLVLKREGTRHRIEPVVGDDEGLFVQKAVAGGTEPVKAVDLAEAAHALDDELEGLRPEARRKRHPGDS